MELSKQNQSRRNFLKLAAGIAGVSMVSGSAYLLKKTLDSPDLTDEIWHLNPGFRLREISGTEVELVSNLGNGKTLQHRFQGLEADLLREIAAEKKVTKRITILAGKNQLTVEKCRKDLNRSIKEFANARLVYTGDKMLVFKREA